MGERGHLRIGELSRRTGVSVELLRAWEKRYGLLDPDRSDGGFRLYSDEDVARVRSMQAHLADGLAAAEASRRALENGGGEAVAGDLVAQSKRELADALAGFSEGRANAVLDRLLGALSVDAVLTEVVLPYLHELGEAWERGEATVAQEHFASNVLRGRLLGLGRGWGEGSGPQALLACAPGEQHDLGLIAFGIALRNRGWRITYLGQDTPLATIEHEARALKPDRVVLVSAAPARLAKLSADLARLAKAAPLALAGAGASAELAAKAGATLLADDPISEAERLTRGLRAGARSQP
ncbi:MAG TPA: MerR family transcriptional regulator [Gaiellaceae bacterium]|nr:MerR family transcriptional regulator [Gaiellaceae bacterium]